MMTEADRGKTMKITEPKTPFIRYNIDKDEVYGHTGNFNINFYFTIIKKNIYIYIYIYKIKRHMEI